MNTEIADMRNGDAFAWVCYDADCPMCRRWAGRFQPLLKRNGIELIPLQTSAVRAFLKLPDKKLLEEMRVITPDGEVYGGADAFVYLARVIPGGQILDAIARLPGVPPIIRAVYRWIARNRSCDGGACELPRRTARRNAIWFDALPLWVLTTVAFAFGHRLPAWAWMWTICFALFLGCKCLVLQIALRRGEKPCFARAIGFLFGWIGMNAKEFFNHYAKPAEPRINEWLFAAGKILLGAALVWGVSRKAFGVSPQLAGWTGMFGLVLLLHFGLFELLALGWRKAGVAVTPLMRAPIKAHSLTEFWGRRWNTGFHQLTEEFAFNPARRVLGPRVALFFAFVLSGVLHDLVISIPARGGYGLPTIYFILQGAGVLFERTVFARRWGAGSGWRGWLFTIIVTAGPAFWLFHPPFIRTVMIPFLQTLNAL